MDILRARKKAQQARTTASSPESSTTRSPGPPPSPATGSAPASPSAAVGVNASSSRAAPTSELPSTLPSPLPSPLPSTLPSPSPSPLPSTLPSPLPSTLPSPLPAAAAIPAAPPSGGVGGTVVPGPAMGDPLHGFLAVDDVDGGLDAGSEQRAEVADRGQRYLAFRIGAEEYAASIMDIKEILTIRAITEVPRAPRDVLGIISRRGVVLPVVDLGATLALRNADHRSAAAQRVLVAGEGDRACGFRVDSVSEVVRLPTAAIEAVPASLGQRNAGLLLGLGRAGPRLFILLDVPAVLDALAAAVGLAPQPRTERLL
jgi:purine-binding chemotaxis protein CheW